MRKDVVAVRILIYERMLEGVCLGVTHPSSKLAGKRGDRDGNGGRG